MEKVKYIDSLRLYLTQNEGSDEWALALIAEADDETEDSLDYPSQIRIGEDLRVYRTQHEPEAEFELLALNVLVPLSMTLISQGIIDFNFANLKKYVESIMHYPSKDIEDGFMIIVPKLRGLDHKFAVIFCQDRGDIFVQMSNGLVVKQDGKDIVDTQESIRLTMGGVFLKYPLQNKQPTEIFANFYSQMESVLIQILQDYAEQTVQKRYDK